MHGTDSQVRSKPSRELITPIFGTSDVFFSEFVYDFECTLFDQPYRNPHSAQNDTQMEYIWVSHETERIDSPFCHL